MIEHKSFWRQQYINNQNKKLTFILWLSLLVIYISQPSNRFKDKKLLNPINWFRTMSIIFSNISTKTAGSYFYIAAGCFFYDLLFYDCVKPSAPGAEGYVTWQSRQHPVRKVLSSDKVISTWCASFCQMTKSSALGAEAFVGKQCLQHPLRRVLPRKEA